MGCVASKLENDDEVVLLCRERKRLLKSAVERRYALADAHCKYFHSMYTVAAALTLFVARHSSPSSPFLITFPPPDNDSSLPTEKLISNPMFLQQKPSEPTQETIHFQDSDSSDSSEEGNDGVVLQQQHHHQHHYQHHQHQHQQVQAEQVCGYFYTGMPPPMPSPQRDFGWDFFNPFEGVRPEVSNPFVGGFSRTSDEDLRVVREQEGIPELEEEGVEKRVMIVENDEDDDDDDDENVDEENGIEVMKVVGGTNVSRGGDQKGLTVIDTPVRGRELLEALRDVADHFIRAYDNGKDVSKMLEVNRVHLQSGLDEIKENSSKLVQAITWNKSSSSASSTKSFLASSSKSSSSWTEFKNELFDDDYGGMEAGSHSQTLGRLYAWEKKLYEEVKAGDSTRKLYDRKCAQLKNQDVKGDDARSMDKTRAVVKDLYTRMLVAIRTAESISERIEKLRDEELHPQLIELLQGLMKTWKVVLESHETQNKIMYEVKSFTCPTYGKFCNDSHRLATVQLDAQLQNWRACFTGYVTAQKAYIEALNGWLSKFVVPEVELYSKGRSSTPPYQIGGPPLLMIARDWSNSLQKLPDRSVAYAIKSFGKDVRALSGQQAEEQQQKRKVDGLAKELDRRITAFQRAESRILESKLSEQKLELDVENRVEYLTDRKDLLDMFRKRLDTEKEKHHNYMQETQRITLNGFQTGLSSVFESLTEFSKASLKMYNELVDYSEKAKVGDDKGDVPSYIQDSHGGVNGGVGY